MPSQVLIDEWANFPVSARRPSAAASPRGKGWYRVLGANVVRPAPPLPPEPVQPPTLTPCPSGWSERAIDDGPVVCDPWADLELGDCPDGSARFPGEPACTLVSVPCPASPYPTNLPAGPVVYLNADAPLGGTGTLATPFSTLSAAIAAAPEGATIALARGSYQGGLALPRSVKLQGVCATEVAILAEKSPTPGSRPPPPEASTPRARRRPRGIARSEPDPGIDTVTAVHKLRRP